MHKYVNHIRIPFVNIACCKAKGAYLSLPVDNQMQFKAVKPLETTVT